MFRFIPATVSKPLAVAALLLAAAVSQTAAQPLPMLVPCSDRQAVVDILGKQYGEQRHGLGLTLGGQVLEIFVAKSGHWSALLSYADGRTCMIAAGESWLDEPFVAGEGS
jgi:hypothetical protein